MTALKSNKRLALGRLIITRGIFEYVPEGDFWAAVTRHTNGDWGEVCDSDWELNDAALTNNARVLSIYTADNGVRFWIITEWDRSSTTVLLPLEY